VNGFDLLYGLRYFDVIRNVSLKFYVKLGQLR